MQQSLKFCKSLVFQRVVACSLSAKSLAARHSSKKSTNEGTRTLALSSEHHFAFAHTSCTADRGIIRNRSAHRSNCRVCSSCWPVESVLALPSYQLAIVSSNCHWNSARQFSQASRVWRSSGESASPSSSSRIGAWPWSTRSSKMGSGVPRLWPLVEAEERLEEGKEGTRLLPSDVESVKPHRLTPCEEPQLAPPTSSSSELPTASPPAPEPAPAASAEARCPLRGRAEPFPFLLGGVSPSELCVLCELMLLCLELDMEPSSLCCFVWSHSCSSPEDVSWFEDATSSESDPPPPSPLR
mmetsp:Transcript_156270/g.501390  ORF Transcript_156270/g.501390 Transcript_156270/m.501390 type:complete len:298 (+) Transcript_156270:1444-2337(+)